MTVELGGAGLSHLDGVFSTGKGLTLELLPLPADRRRGDSIRSARITLANDAPLSPSEIRLYDSTGLSAPKIFQVDQWPEVQETEPNNEPEKANDITLPAVINGRIGGSADVDCFRFAVKGGQSLICKVDSERLLANIGEGPLEGLLELLDETGKVVAENNGSKGWEPLLTYTPPRDGVYTLRLRDFLWRGAPSAIYRLTVGVIPYAETLFPQGGQRGTTVHSVVSGFNMSTSQVFSLPTTDSVQTREVRISGPAGLSNAVPFPVGDNPEVMEQEPNDTIETANRVPVPVTINGKLDHDGDRDRFRFHAEKGQRMILEVMAARLGSPFDSVLALRDPQGNLLSENDDAIGKDSLLEQVFPVSGDYTVVVRDVDLRGGPNFTYRLSIEPARPQFQLTVTPDTLAVPRGGAARLDVKVKRQYGFDGPVTMHLEDLPPGMHASTAVIPAGMDRAILTVEGVDAASAAKVTVDKNSSVSALQPAAPGMVRVVGTSPIGGEPLTRTATALQTYYYQGNPEYRPVIGPVALLGSAASLLLHATTGQIVMDAGGLASFTVQISRLDHPERPFALQVDGLPPGVTAEPVTVTSSSSRQSLVLRAAPDAAGVETDIVVSATLPNAAEKRAVPTVLAVTPVIHLKLNEIPGFVVTAEPAALTLTTGKPASLRVTLARRGGFTGTVDLTISGLPKGVTATPSRIDPGKNSGTLTLLLNPLDRSPSRTGPFEIHVEASGVLGSQKQVRTSEVVKVDTGE